MITKKQVQIALITGLTAFSLSYHQAWAYDPGEQATEEGEILIFSEGTPEAPGAGFYIKEQNSNPGSQLLASDIHQDLTAFVEQNTGGIEEALLASESVQQGEALLAYNEKNGEWEEVLLSALTEADLSALTEADDVMMGTSPQLAVALFIGFLASTLSTLNAPRIIASNMRLLAGYSAAIFFSASAAVLLLLSI